MEATMTEETQAVDDTIAQTEAEQGDVEQGDAGALSLEEQIALLNAENEKLKTNYLRALADAENTRKIMAREIEKISKYGNSNFAKSLLSVADNMQRALMCAPEDVRDSNDLLKNLAIGVEMVEKELQNALSQHGIQQIDSLQQPFDPNFHQAVQEVEDTSVPAQTVVQVMQEGYTINERLLRPAMVVVSRGGPKREAPAKDNADGVDTTA
jgi:molecular chaperone GrpE